MAKTQNMAKTKKVEDKVITLEPKAPIDLDNIVLDLLSPDRVIDLKIKSVFEVLPQTFVIILILPRTQQEQRDMRLMKYFLDKGLKGIYISLNKSSNELTQEMKRKGVDSSKIFFIDAITSMIDGKKAIGENFSYLESPNNLVELSVELDHAIESLGDAKGFVILDSITTLVMYNKDVAVEKFLHSLTQKIRDHELKGILFAAESTNNDILDTLSQFCDDTKNL
ncbi:MAG: hypothetical protein NTY48_04625 [Candidatus Diapherotrites archaeon]|nr:hypothetical protein [Candidatus Diapherotrites archaeon]